MVINEMKNLDYKYYFNLIKKREIKRGIEFKDIDAYNNIFGEYLGYDETLNKDYKGSLTLGFNPSSVVYVKNGIEVMRLKPHTTATGKTTIKGWSMVELKRCLKINGFRGYSKMPKDEIIDLLIKM